jgi:dienelactone hydrolase
MFRTVVRIAVVWQSVDRDVELDEVVPRAPTGEARRDVALTAGEYGPIRTPATNYVRETRSAKSPVADGDADMSSSTVPIGPTRTRRMRALGIAGSALMAATLATGSATATIVERQTFADSYSFTGWDCGYPMEVQGSFSDELQVRLDNKNADIAYFTTRHSFKETWTAEDGRSFSLAGHNLWKDIRAKRVEGQRYDFTFHESGQPVTITDSSGKVVARDRGTASFFYTVDLATGAGADTGSRVSGPHPTFDMDLCLIVASLVAPADSRDSAQYLTPRPIGSTDSPMGFDEYLPPSYTATGDKSPLLLFFHGYGETGDGSPEALSSLVRAGIPKYIDVGGWPVARPFVVLAPQHVEGPGHFDFSSCDNQPLFNGSCNMQAQHDLDNASPAFCTTPDEVDAFIDYAVGHYNVDPARVYITGLSCGAYGIWEYLAKYHAGLKVAAAIPIAGDGRPGSSGHYCDLDAAPLWAFHGLLDETVDPNGSIEPMEALAACPGVPADEAKLTVYPDRDHNSWDPAYGGADGNDIYSWMLGFTNP